MKRSSGKVLKTLGKFASRGGQVALTSFALVLSLTVASCSRESDRFAGDTYRLPWPDSEGQIALRPVQLKTLNDPENFEGSAARILVEPAESSGRLIAEKPRGRYIRSGSGTMIPSNYATLQAVTAYAHQEKLQSFDEKNGAATYLKWPLTIGLQVKVVDRGAIVNNNAIYDGKLDALLVVPYSLSDLPIALNGGILAHEHFHFIFQKAVLDRIGVQQSQGCQHGIAQTEAETPSAPQETETETGLDLDLGDEESIARAADEIAPGVYNAFLLRAINEGLADFWGWSYSGDVEFVGRSLPSEERVRRLDLEAGKLMDARAIRQSLVDLRRADKVIREDYRIGRAYLLGTQYARFLKGLVSALVEQGTSPEVAKGFVTAALVKALPTLGTAVVASYATDYISPNLILKPLILNLPDVKAPVCTALENFRATETGYQKPAACSGGTQ